MNREQGIQAWRKLRWRERRNEGLEHHFWGKRGSFLWQEQDKVKIRRKSGYTAEVLNWRPSGHTGPVVFYSVNTVITYF